jgi:hypothetical protein
VVLKGAQWSFKLCTAAVELNFNMRERTETVTMTFIFQNLTILKTGVHDLDVTVFIDIRANSATESKLANHDHYEKP